MIRLTVRKTFSVYDVEKVKKKYRIELLRQVRSIYPHSAVHTNSTQRGYIVRDYNTPPGRVSYFYFLF